MKSLVLCSGCTRHVRANEAACPFCGAAVDAAAITRPATRVIGPATSRAAILFLGAVAATGCGEPNKPGDPSSAPPSGTPTFAPVPPYGVAMPDPTLPAPVLPPPPPPASNGGADAGAPDAGPLDSGKAKPGASASAKPAGSSSVAPPPPRIVPPYGVPPIPPEKKKPK